MTRADSQTAFVTAGVNTTHDNDERFEAAAGATDLGCCRNRPWLEYRILVASLLVVVRCTRLAEVLERPGTFFASLEACLGLDAGEIAELLETAVGVGSAAEGHGIIPARSVWHDALDVCVNEAIHRPVEGLARLHPSIEDPSPAKLIFDLAVRQVPIPRHMPPKIVVSRPICDAIRWFVRGQIGRTAEPVHRASFTGPVHRPQFVKYSMTLSAIRRHVPCDHSAL